MRKCKFQFEDSPAFDGVTDDTRWNGFLNVRVTTEVRDEIVRWFRAQYSDPDTEQGNLDMLAIPPDRDGLIDLGSGYATTEFDPDEAMAHIGRGRVD
jgi:hypothetical protein